MQWFFKKNFPPFLKRKIIKMFFIFKSFNFNTCLCASIVQYMYITIQRKAMPYYDKPILFLSLKIVCLATAPNEFS